MVAPNKQRTLTKLLTVLGKSYDAQLPKELSVLDHLLLGVVQEGMGFSQSIEAYQKLISAFHDLNELRVSHVDEVMDSLVEGVPDRALKAKRITQILQFVFETTYSYDLEQMKKKPLKQAQKQLSKIQGTNPFIVNAVVQRSLGGHALPVDEPMVSLLRQLQILEEEETVEQMQATLEHLIPKAKGLAFCVHLSELAFEGPKKQKTLLKDLIPAPSAKSKAAKLAAPPEEAKPAAGKKSAEKKSSKKK